MTGPNGAGGPSLLPEGLLDSADRMLTTRVPGLGSLWPRACALLIRLALERSLDRYWARVLPAGAECGMRQQLLLLPHYTRDSRGVGPAEAFDATLLAREAWLGLAGAAHHHAYELAPTAVELRRWHTAVSRLDTLLVRQAPEAGCPKVVAATSACAPEPEDRRAPRPTP